MDQVRGRVAGRAEVDEFDVRVGGEGGGNLVRDWLEGVGCVQGHFDYLDVVGLGRDGVHAVGWRAGQDLVFAGGAEGTEEGVDGFITADADEKVVRGQGFLCVGFGVAQVAEELFKRHLVRVRISIEA